MAYYNTTSETGHDLDRFNIAANSQVALVFAFLKLHHAANWTASEVCIGVRWPGRTPPITSVRRALTDLADLGVIRKTTDKRKGPYDRAEYAWKFRQPPRQEELFTWPVWGCAP